MSAWAKVKLGEICEFKYGKSLPQGARQAGEFSVYGSNGIVGSHSRSLTTGPTIVVGRKGSLGEVNYSELPCWPIDTTYYVDESATDVNLRWLYHCLGSLGLTRLNRAAAIPGLNREDAYRLLVLLPPIDEQRRIAQTLDHADTLRAKRREAIARLDELTQSIFIDTFGADWVEFPKHPLGEVALVDSGITKGRRTTAETRPVPYMAVSNVQDKRLDLSIVKTIDATDAEIDRLRLAAGDLLLTEGGDPDKLGRGTVWNNELPECIFQNHIFRVRAASGAVDPIYLSWVVGSRYGKSYFLRSAKQTTGIATINKSQLRRFPVPIAPLSLQKEFLARLAKVEEVGTGHIRAVEGADLLFESLQARAFRGGL